MRVRPVVEDVAEQVDGSAPDRLWAEEVVWHKGDAGGEGGRDAGGVQGGEHVREVLDDEVQVRVRLGDGDADVAAGAADIDDGVILVIAMAVGGMAVGGMAVGDMVTDGRPGIALIEETWRETEAVGEGGHGARETFGHV